MTIVGEMWESLEGKLMEHLGESYGGPVLCFENGKFQLVTWYDAPVTVLIKLSTSIEVHAEGRTLFELVDNIKELNNEK